MPPQPDKPRGPSDATDYSSTKAPETQVEAEQQQPQPTDARLLPGGAHGAAADTGMSALDRDTTMSSTLNTRPGESGRAEPTQR
jgi:hypothetical protein